MGVSFAFLVPPDWTAIGKKRQILSLQLGTMGAQKALILPRFKGSLASRD